MVSMSSSTSESLCSEPELHLSILHSEEQRKHLFLRSYYEGHLSRPRATAPLPCDLNHFVLQRIVAAWAAGVEAFVLTLGSTRSLVIATVKSGASKAAPLSYSASALFSLRQEKHRSVLPLFPLEKVLSPLDPHQACFLTFHAFT